VLILIAEDNQAVRKALHRFLHAADSTWDILEAENGNQAVALARQHRVDLIILDQVMPEMSGLAAARVISHARPGIPILLHTAFPTEVLSRESERYGVRSVISKTDGRNLLAAIRDVDEGNDSTETEPPVV
jgi:two-component system, NarL family, response regulator LiaR